MSPLLVTALACAAALAVWAFLAHRRWLAAAAALGRHAEELERECARSRAALASEACFRAIVEAAADLIFRLDAGGRCVYVNPAALEQLGYTEAELLGRSCLDLVRSDYRDRARRFYEDQIVQALPSSYCEFPIRRRDGSDVWIGQRVQLVYENGALAGMQALARDITELKLLQQTIEREREQLRRIVSHAPVAMAMLDRDGRHVAHSARWLRYMGVKDPSVVGRTLAEVWPGMPARYARVQERALAGEVVHEPEDVVDRHDGTCAYLRWTAQPWLDAQGEVAGVVLVVQNIDMLVRARQAALEASRLKSEFVANMSHEIRTPMNGVIGMTRLLLDTPLTAEQRDYAEVIDQSGRALLEIIDDVLDFSKIEAGRLDLETVDFDLRRAVRGVIGSFAEPAQAKGLELLSLIHHDVPSALRGDPGRLRQVLTNLVGNAVKFTERGEVVLRVRLAPSESDPLRVRFEVSDTGIGIDPELRRRLFQSFVQADGSSSRRHGGTGLGLAISKRLVVMMGGEIDLVSQLGRGSSFHFTVPFERQPSDATGPAPAPPQLAGRRVLVVDDNATNRQILRQQLGHWGMRVSAADAGARALEMLRQAAESATPFDLAILDLRMPKMDGLALARAIKAVPCLAPLKLVLLTSFGQRGHGAEAARIGISAYLTKPVDESDLYDSLVETLGEDDPARGRRLVTRHSLREARPPGSACILVAEDNEVNQKVAVKILEKLGYRVELAADGREALVACERTHYDAVLMDGQMPDIDGYEATRRIRAREAGGRRTPIIAMTASAMKGDRERCLEAGMDDYICKPVTPEEVQRVLRRWLTPQPGAPAKRRPGSAATGLLEEATIGNLMSLDDDGTLIEELVATFLGLAPGRIAAIRSAAERADAAELGRSAHTLGGSCANLGCRGMKEVCARLELLARSSSLEAAPELARELEAEFEAVRPRLEALPERHPLRAPRADRPRDET